MRFYQREVGDDGNTEERSGKPGAPRSWRCVRARTPNWRNMPAASFRRAIGYIPLWLLVVYAVLFVWALYYIVRLLGRSWDQDDRSSDVAAHA